MKHVAHWREDGFQELPVGGKARALGLLSEAGFRVPEGCVILPSAFEAEAGILEKEVSVFLDRHDGLFAVRSSAVDEDGATHSFAGQLESFLNVSRDEVLDKVRLVWQSGFSERIVLYRKQAGLTLPPPVPAVLVQHMVPSEVAGVAFSADPVSGRRGVVVIAAVRGLGEALVSGARTGDSFHVDREDRVISNEVVEPGNPTLSEAAILEIARLARSAACHFGRPQDIEWAMAGGRLYLLQSRPITSLSRQIDPDGAWQLYDNSNIAESYGGVTTPLTFSFARHVYEEVYHQFVKILRVPERRIEANRDVFGRMLGLVRGHVFYNLLSWYRVLAMLPGFAVNRHFMEQMMGVKEPLPEDVLKDLVGSPRKTTLRDYVEIGGTLAGLIASHVSLPKSIEAFYVRLEETLKPGALAAEDLRPDELAAAYRKLQNQLLTRWDAPLINDFFAMIFFGMSRKLVDKWCGDPDGTLQNDLISCQGGIISAEPAKRMIHLAGLARQSPELLAALQDGSLGDIRNLMTNAPEFQSEYQRYLEKFGDRCLEELKLESATLHDNPLVLLRSIGRLAGSPERAAFDRDAVGKSAMTRVEKALSGHALRRAIFSYVIRQTRDRVRDRENLRFERTRVFGRVRRIFVELGKRLYAQDLLERPRDIFYLQAEEALGFVEGTAVTTDLKSLAKLRREEFAEFGDNPPAGRFETRGLVYVGHGFEGKKAMDSEIPSGEESKGLGCCPGIVRARVRVILDPRDARIHPGEILVAPRTDPGWIMLFPSASGLLVEHGSLLSHSAIVAREMGIPAVVSIAGLTSWLQTGDLVELDGSTGRVTRLQPEEAHAE
jgi:pyruvate,water dikinase